MCRIPILLPQAVTRVGEWVPKSWICAVGLGLKGSSIEKSEQVKLLNRWLYAFLFLRCFLRLKRTVFPSPGILL